MANELASLVADEFDFIKHMNLNKKCTEMLDKVHTNEFDIF
jgi:hypothetical protein